MEMVYFIKQFDRGEGDNAKERGSLLNDVTIQGIEENSRDKDLHFLPVNYFVNQEPIFIRR